MKTLGLVFLLSLVSCTAKTNDALQTREKVRFGTLSSMADFSYPKYHIKCENEEKDIWPKFYISGNGKKGVVVYWVGFCEDGNIGGVYSHEKGWFQATGNLAQAVEIYKDYQGSGVWVNFPLTID